MPKASAPNSPSPNPSGFEPTGYRVLVLPDVVKQKTAGGILIPETARDDHGRAQILGNLIAVGPDAWDKYPKPWAKPGDRVMFARYGGLLVTGRDGLEYRILNDDQITAVVDPAVSLTDTEIHRQREAYGS